MFRVGDKVLLIDNAENRRHFSLPKRSKVKVGNIYTVRKVDPTVIYLEEYPGNEGFFPHRFSLVDLDAVEGELPICRKIREMYKRRKDMGYAF